MSLESVKNKMYDCLNSLAKRFNKLFAFSSVNIEDLQCLGWAGGPDLGQDWIMDKEMEEGIQMFCSQIASQISGEKIPGGINFEGITFRPMQGACRAVTEEVLLQEDCLGAVEEFVRDLSRYVSAKSLFDMIPSGKIYKGMVKRQYFRKKTGEQVTKYYEMYRFRGSGKICYHVPKKFVQDFELVIREKKKLKSKLKKLKKRLAMAAEELQHILHIRLKVDDLIKKWAEAQKVCSEEQSKRMLAIRDKICTTQAHWNISRYGRETRCVSVCQNLVSSRVEAIFADLMEETGNPFLCEKEVYIKRNFSYTTDFCYRSIFSGDVNVEIFGKMDKLDYVSSSVRKIYEYSRKGIKMGKNLIVFVCGSGSVLNAAIMKKVFLMSMLGYIPVGPVFV